MPRSRVMRVRMCAGGVGVGVGCGVVGVVARSSWHVFPWYVSQVGHLPSPCRLLRFCRVLLYSTIVSARASFELYLSQSILSFRFLLLHRRGLHLLVSALKIPWNAAAGRDWFLRRRELWLDSSALSLLSMSMCAFLRFLRGLNPNTVWITCAVRASWGSTLFCEIETDMWRFVWFPRNGELSASACVWRADASLQFGSAAVQELLLCLELPCALLTCSSPLMQNAPAWRSHSHSVASSSRIGKSSWRLWQCVIGSICAK